MTPWEEGNPQSQLLVLAEAPGRVELRNGRPLCGPSGDVFNDCLHAAGLARRQCYILNVWPFLIWKVRKGSVNEKFYPYDSPRGPDDLLWSTKTGFTEYGLQEAGPTLERIQASGANCILTMGQQALDLATGKSRAIMKWRGSPLTGLPRIGERKLIPTVHPAATIHGTYTWRYLIISDMEKAKRHMEFAALRLPQRTFILNPSLRDVLEYLGRPAERLATDLEVINHQVTCLSLCYDPSEAMTVPFSDERGQPWWDEEEEALIWLAYAQRMGDPVVAKINQNLIGFDAPFLLQQNNIYTRGFLGDTMVAQHIMYPDFPKGLDFITSIHTDEPYYKDEGKMWKGLGGDIEQFWTYCGKDSAVALEAWDVLAAEMTASGYWPTYDMTARLSNPLQYMTIRGLNVDRDKLASTKTRVDSEIAAREAELHTVAEWPFSPTSPAQCVKYFYETKGITPYKNKDGGITTDDKAMARIYRRFNLREAKLVQEIRALRKLKGTYLEIQLDKDERLRCSWNPRGTWTGRLSSSQTIFGTGANLQNLHPEFLEFIVAD